jgi:hypothetical protein
MQIPLQVRVTPPHHEQFLKEGHNAAVPDAAAGGGVGGASPRSNRLRTFD